MQVNFHDVTNIHAASSYGETASWIEITVSESNAFLGTTKGTVVIFTKEKDSILCAKLAQAINQCFAEANHEVAR